MTGGNEGILGAGCEAVDEDLSALIDGELAPGRVSQVETHVAGCPRCRGRLAALRAVDRGLAKLALPALPGNLRERLQRRIERPAVAAGRRGPAPRRRWLLVPAAAAAAAALALAFLLQPSHAPQPATVARVETSVPEEAPAPAPERPPAAPEPAVVATLDAGAPAPVRAPVTVPERALAPPAPAPLEIESVEDLDVIANLELLEAFVAMEGGTG